MGYTEALNKCGIDFESEAHLKWADSVFEIISYNAIQASCELAREKGKYETFEGSDWSKGILTIDSARDSTCNEFSKEEWASLRAKVVEYGMRNCNLMAVAPTATIANILGTTACIELAHKPVYLKENLGGVFQYVDPCVRHNKSLCKYAYDVDQTWIIRAVSVVQKWCDQSISTNLHKRKEIKGSTVSEWYKLANKLGLKSTYYLKTEKKASDAKKAGQK